MNELSNNKKAQPLSDREVISLGFCPHCHCPDSSVSRTKKISHTITKRIGGERQQVSITKIIRYRRCDHCGENFRTKEEATT